MNNPIFARYKFQRQDQLEHESIEHNITALKVLVKDCEFTENFEKEMVRDRLICWLKLNRIREKLLSQGGSLTLETTVTIARAFETTQQQLMFMSAVSLSPTTVKEPNVKQELDYVRRQKKYDQPTTSKKCYFCGGACDPNQKCPAKGKSCSKC